MGQDSSAGITSHYEAERSGDRIPASAGFSVPVQTVSGAHPASYTNAYRVFPGGKATGAWR